MIAKVIYDMFEKLFAYCYRKKVEIDKNNKNAFLNF